MAVPKKNKTLNKRTWQKKNLFNFKKINFKLIKNTNKKNVIIV